VAEELSFEQMQEEQREEQLADQYEQLVALPGWTVFLSHVDEWVKTALERMEASDSNDPVITQNLNQVWKQRRMLREFIRIHVERTVEVVKEKRKEDRSFILKRQLQVRQAFKEHEL
jgi:molybdopterin biosynthesis enzyme